MEALRAACDRAAACAVGVMPAVARVPGAALHTEVRFFCGEVRAGLPERAWSAAAATLAATWTPGALLQVQETAYVTADTGDSILFCTLACGAGGCAPTTQRRRERLQDEDVDVSGDGLPLTARVSVFVEHDARAGSPATAAPLRVRVRQLREYTLPPAAPRRARREVRARDTADAPEEGPLVALALTWSAPSASAADAAMSQEPIHEMLIRVTGGACAGLGCVAVSLAAAMAHA